MTDRPLLVVAGDPSGDRHGAHLVRALRRREPGLPLVALGGDALAAAGAPLLYNLPRQMAIMGFWPVVLRLPRIGRLLELVRQELDRHPPRAVLLIDYPGFNFQVAEICSRRGIPVLYYIPPQIWAWAPWRMRRLARLASKLLVIFPFEERLYREHGVPVSFVGHPLCEQLDGFVADRETIERTSGGRPVLGLLPGSRAQEIRGVLPMMLRAAEALASKSPQPFAVLLAAAAARHLPLLEGLAASCKLPVHVLLGQTHSIVARSRVCLVTSGTATLETAYLGTPLVILYRVNCAAGLVARWTPFLATPHFGLPNIVAGRAVVPEQLFWRDISGRVAEQAAGLWADGAQRDECLAGLEEVRRRLQTGRPASEAAAEQVLAFLAANGS